MKRDVKSLLSVSSAAMDQASTSNNDIHVEVYLDIRDDSGVFDSTDVVDESIPITYG